MRLAFPQHLRIIKSVVRSDKLIGVVWDPVYSHWEQGDCTVGQIGTLARVGSLTRLPGREARIVVVGLERFAVGRRDLSVDFEQYDVTPHEDFNESRPLLNTFADEVRQFYIRYMRATHTIADEKREAETKLPDDPVKLSMVLPAMLSLDEETLQRFLASRSPLMRLRELSAVLSPAVQGVEAGAETHARSRGNGHGAKRS
jgi:Lon protease-like protein